ncbi:MAG: glycosyltransferase N-terminal domain-containing protein [Pirellulales bacterium]
MSRLYSWLLNVFYLAALAAFSPLVLWAMLRTGKYREGYAQKLLGLVPWREGDATCIWLHAVSVGEVNLLATLLGELRGAHPDWEFVVSTTSRAGYELARKKYADLAVFYCPLDFSWAVRRAMRRVRPSLLVLAELELWPNLILAAKEQGVRVAIVNGRMSDKSFPRYRRIRPLVAHFLRQLDLIAVPSVESAARFQRLGAPADRVRITGSLKFDGAETDRGNPRTAALRRLAAFAEDDVIFLAGSTQEPEEELAIDIYRRLSPAHPRLRLVLVPRHPERFDGVARLLAGSGLPWVRRSTIDDRREPMASRPVVLVDTVGELAAWWGTATIAFVGGSFGSRGGQNMIEPAAYGAAVAFGPNTWNFRDIVASLRDADAAVIVRDGQQLEAYVRRCLEEPLYAATLGVRAQSLVKGQLGATRRTVARLESLLAASAKGRLARRSAA